MAEIRCEEKNDEGKLTGKTVSDKFPKLPFLPPTESGIGLRTKPEEKAEEFSGTESMATAGTNPE